MNAVRRNPLAALAPCSCVDSDAWRCAERAQLDAVLADDQWLARRALTSGLCERESFAALSDLEIACAYEHGDVDLHDALYCELHLRRLTPWKICDNSATDVTP